MSAKPKTCVFGATISKGPFKGDMYDCGAPAVADYFDPLYRCRRPVCKRHINVVLRNDKKFKRDSTVQFFDKPQ